MYKGNSTGAYNIAMIKPEPMKLEDFLAVMQANKGVYPDYDKLPDEAKVFIGNLNIITGTAESYLENGFLIGVGGIRYIGIGEAWFLTIPELRERSMTLLRAARENLRRMRDEKNLWRLYATSKISTNFLKHLGFEQESNLVWTRKEPNGRER
jgi:hypothetical protein